MKGRNTYWYRTTRPYESGVTDGFDMVRNKFSHSKSSIKSNAHSHTFLVQMAGGNIYDIRDFNVASKWFYNWVEDSSIVKMQPEGQTIECPTCVRTGTFTIKAFDMRDNVPQPTDKLGIHIPITTTFDNTYGTDYVHSYWISYRAGGDGDAFNGASIHQVWWELYGSAGSYFYSMMYDTSGHTPSKQDSFLEVGSCYQISPSAYMKDRDSDSVEGVRPVICVEGVNEGVDITVTVSFLNKNSLPPAKTNYIEHPRIDCSSAYTQISQTIDSSKHNVLHVTASGSTSKLNIALNGDSTAYFHDE